MPACPVCGSGQIVETIRRDRLPVLQNVVWSSREEALAAPVAPFVLGTCADCGFSFNTAFDPSLAIYDERYDNSVPASTYREHCRSVAEMLVDKLELGEGSVYEVGCGKGEFLAMLCARAPAIRGVGIDPTCAPGERGNLKLIRAALDPSHRDPAAKAVIVRHILEHIAEPVAFMATIRRCFPGATVYVEVPDLNWILGAMAFWDFSYEHCNYFTAASLATCLTASGYSIMDRRPAFGNQYQWALCRPGLTAGCRNGQGAEAVYDVLAYAGREAEQIARIEAIVQKRGGIAVWGMATKGVVLCSMLSPEAVLGGIDENPNKQGLYAAGSGVRIHPPSWARCLPKGTATLVMNPNYAREIAETARRVGADIELPAA